MRTPTIIYLLILISLCPPLQAQSTLPVNSTDGDTTYNITEYLLHYNFLSSFYLESNRRPPTSELTQAVKDLQYMASLPESGILDETTYEIIRTQRCDVPDYVDLERSTQGRSRGVAKRWNRLNLSWSVARYPTASMPLTRKAILDAIKFWQNHSNFTFQEYIPPNLRQADIQIWFEVGFHGDAYPFLSDERIGHCFPNAQTNHTSIHLNGDRYFNWNFSRDAVTNNMYLVVVHELGHALGLTHSNEPESVMFPWFNKTAPLITDRDRQQLASLWGGEDNDLRISTTILPDHSTKHPSCPSSVDSVLLARDKIYFFMDQHYWIVWENKVDQSDHKMAISKYWYGFSPNLTGIDAAYEVPQTGEIVFFIGKRYYQFLGNRKSASSPEQGRPIADYNLPSTIENIDAVFVWGENLKTYIISGNMYWRYDEQKGSVDPGYPRDMNLWKGVPLPVDAAFRSFDGNLYFVKGSEYWKFDDVRMSVDPSYPRPLRELIQCDTNTLQSLPTVSPSTTTYTSDSNSMNDYNLVYYLTLLAVLLMLTA